MKVRKIAACVLAAAMIASFGILGTGCGKPSQDENTVRIARWALEWEKDIFRDWTKTFTDANPDITIEWEFVPYTAHFDRLRTDLLSSKAADIIFVNNWGWKPYSNIDVFEDLGAVSELASVRSSLVSSAQSGLKQGEKLVGLPVGMVSRVPIVNNADFHKAGVAVPWDRETSFTGSELTALMQSVADGANRDTGINITLTDAISLFCASADAPIVTTDGRIGCNTPAGVAAVQNFVHFAKSGYAVPLSENLSGSYGSPDSAILSGRVVAGFCCPGEFKGIIDAGYSVSAIPCLKADGGRDTVLADFNTLVVPKFSGSKKAAYRVIEWMLSEEAQLAYAKFADLPTNAAAFDEIMTDSENWSPELYQAYGVGIDNIFVPPAMNTTFQTYLGGALKDLLDGKYTPQQFCEYMKAGENLL